MWLVQAYLITVVLSAATVWGLARFTVWGRQFWSLTAAYFLPRRDWRPLATLLLILFLTLCAVRLDVLLSDWSNTMYTSLQNLDSTGFWRAMVLFAILATVHVLRVLIEFYVQQAFTIRWRVWLNEELLSRWLDRQTYYRTQYLDTPIDNPDQRIQQDVATFVEMSLVLSMGVVNALVSTFAFTLILWTLSGPLSAMGVELPRGMVFLVFAYVIIATVFAVKIGRPLIMLNFLNERFNADYRYALVRLREYSESIAFYAGEKVEGALLRSRFTHVISNAWAIVFRSIKFQGFNLSVSQAAVVFPFIIQAQRFFSKQISLGDLMQTAQAFGRLQDNLSFFRTAYDSFATYRATLDRLSGFTKAIAESRELPEPTIHAQGPRLAVEQLTIHTPAAALLIDSLTIEVSPNAPLLIQGPSGSGKTTLLRAIAGLWPYCDGTIIRPEENVLFLSQKPYLPLGTLRDALYYPQQLPSLDTAPQAAIHQQQEAAIASAHGAPSDLDALATSRSVELGTEPETSSLAVHADALDASGDPRDSAPPDAETGAASRGRAEEVLHRVQMGHLVDRLDQVADWGRILSLGEQQRLAFGRLLLSAPAAAFLDEATSAMDEGLEDAMYRLVREQLPHTRLVSVGHRSTLAKHHACQLILKGKGTGAWVLAGIS
ncbi:ABC transporter ATP-binding protein [Pollutimonas subterranea]|uniref:ABC transporter ATP-binding protein n=2 Tax=Pollutimonas subterranea TaxID=2045210 RepID=A0A2N4UA12_9BURK|nr:ABC transporter ATP-binding protein [Pollutimonas subterranea]